MSSLPKPVRYGLASLIGAVAVPAASVAFEMGAIMLLVGLVAGISAIIGVSPFKQSALPQIGIEIFVVVLAALVFVGAIEISRLLTPRSARRAFYRRAVVAALSAAGASFPVLGIMAYATLHGRTEPGLPLPLVVTAVVLHVVAGLIVWPLWLLRPELKYVPWSELGDGR